MNINV